MRRLLFLLFLSTQAFGQGATINAGKLNGIVFADQQSGESVREKIDKAAASCDALSRFCPIFIPPNMGPGEPSTLPPGVTFVDLRKGFYLKGSSGYGEPVLAQGAITRLFTIKDFSNTADNHLHSSAVIELCGSTTPGTCQAANLLENNMVGLTIWSSRPAGTIDAMAGMSVVIRDESGGTASGKGELRGMESDMSAPPGVTAFGSGTAADGNNTGIISQCTGGNDCGIGMQVGNNSRGRWKRAASFTGWSSADGSSDVGVYIKRPSASSANNIVLDNSNPGDGASIVWWDNGPANTRWSFGGPANFGLFDSLGRINRLYFAQVSSGNASSDLNSVGAGQVRLNMEAGSGTAGVIFGSGGRSPREVASISGGGAIQLGSVAFMDLGTSSDGTIIYCEDCTVAQPTSCTNVTTAAACTCTGRGTGAIAKRVHGAWLCQ